MTAEPNAFRPKEIQQELVNLASHAEIIRRFRYRDVDLAAMNGELMTAVDVIVDQLAGHLAAIEAHYRGDRDRDRADDGMISNTEILTDLSAMSRQELVERRARLERDPSPGERAQIGQAMGLLGTVRRTAVVIDHALAEATELRQRLKALSELDLLFAIRGAAVDLVRSLGDREPAADELRGRLQPTAEILESLIDRDLYWELGEPLRQAAFDLHGGVRLWSGGGDDYDTESGRHLWQGLRRLADGLIEVNERHELIEYDRSIIRMVHSALLGPGARSDTIPEATLRQLKNIAGRDPVIDRLMATGDLQVARWREPLERLREGL